MKNLLYKEFRLVAHPTVFLFLFLSAMLMIPNYPYYVTFFYTSLGIFFSCLTGRENHDVFYTVTLPVRKRDMVRARFCFAVLVEAAQLVLAIPFAVLRGTFPLPGNQVGMDANIALFGFSLILLGIFNYVFFVRYYKDPDKVGKAFVLSSTASFGYILIAETCDHIVPFLRDKLDTPDPQFLFAKLVVLAIGLAVFAALTLLAYRRSVRSFEALDL